MALHHFSIPLLLAAGLLGASCGVYHRAEKRAPNGTQQTAPQADEGLPATDAGKNAAPAEDPAPGSSGQATVSTATFATSADGSTSISNLITCDDDGNGWEKNCRLVSNPVTLKAKRDVSNTVKIQYKNTCKMAPRESPLRIIDATTLAVVGTIRVGAAGEFSYHGVGPLVLVDERPSFLAVQKPKGCGLDITIVTVSASSHDESVGY